ncbi:LCP family protein [Candidatus Viridilinea mediisalina]|uniref:Cell envelope-related transcriptional attenuator domain-containing protein n=1 Tax=Candidatus Viridilinea mediisalina TaxID=2024553 RepID=A0A2A6RGV9_9CHLR|nr:LCP family protein [Candidatus Viridilinea mediisalina]PDW02115.1 hypothetical protein CJ255_15640 [Candidatus Viridilinea mediisalina]
MNHPDDQQTLLAELLAKPPQQHPLPPALPRPVRIRPLTRPPNATQRQRPWWHYAIVACLAFVSLSFGLVVGRISLAAYTIRENVVAMHVTAVPPVVEATPTMALPTPEPTLSPTPAPLVFAALEQPSATATPATLVLATADASLPSHAPPPNATPTLLSLPTPIPLPALGSAPVPTLMPTVGVAPVSGNPINLLLLGSDRRPDEGWQSRSDAIMIVRLEPEQQRIALLSLPRDLIVRIPGYGYARVNSTTVVGDANAQLGGGGELARRTISELLGIPIHHVVRADFSAFITAIDAIGGITIEVEHELYDPTYPTMDYRYMVAHFLPGRQHMNGELALMYSRVRHPDSDYFRARRQQQVVQAIIQRVRDQHMLNQVQMLADVSSALRDHIKTDMSFEQMLGVAWAFRNFSPEQLERYTLDENLTSMGLGDDPYAITANPGAIAYVVGQLLGR